MPLPDGVATVTVGGTVVHPITGDPLTGMLTVTVPPISFGGILMAGGSEDYAIDQGVLDHQPILPASDGPSITPANWLAYFDLRTETWSPTFAAALPMAEPETTLATLYARQVAVAPALDVFVPLSLVGQPGGLATLGEDGLLSPDERPAGGGGGINTLTAADTTIVVGGTATDRTVKAGTGIAQSAVSGLTAALAAKAAATDLTAEVSRAEAAESGLSGALADKADATALDAEVTRAQAAETTLTTSVSGKASSADLASEVSRAEAAESTLTTSVGSKAAAADLTAEVGRATAAESAKYTKPGSGIPKADLAAAVQTSLAAADAAATTADLTAEVTRAEAAESTLTTAVAGKAAASDLTAEVSRAEAAEAAKYTKPGTGIPKADLASAAQTSLGKADTALQSASLAILTDLDLAGSVTGDAIVKQSDGTWAAQAISGGGGGFTLIVRSEHVTDGNVDLPDTSGADPTLATSWQVLNHADGTTPFEFTVPASVGDWVEVSMNGVRDKGNNSSIDAGVVVAGGIVRFMATGTGTPAQDGDTGWYPQDEINVSGVRGFEVTSGDLDGGNVVISVVAWGTGATGKLFANAGDTFYWQAKNFGPHD